MATRLKTPMQMLYTTALNNFYCIQLSNIRNCRHQTITNFKKNITFYLHIKFKQTNLAV